MGTMAAWLCMEDWEVQQAQRFYMHSPWSTCCRVAPTATPAPRASTVPPTISTTLVASVALTLLHILHRSYCHVQFGLLSTRAPKSSTDQPHRLMPFWVSL